MTDNLKELSALTALNDMMQKGHFNICTVDSVGELLGIKPSTHEAYKLLRPLHCVDFAKMPTALREAIPSLIQECLGIAPAYQFKTVAPQTIEIEVPQRKPLLRLFGGSK